MEEEKSILLLHELFYTMLLPLAFLKQMHLYSEFLFTRESYTHTHTHTCAHTETHTVQC